MRALLPYLALYKRHKWLLSLGVILAIVTLLASIGLLTLSGWFLSASAVVGFAGAYSFNYMLPAAGVRGAAIIRTAGRYFERLVSHDATFRVLQHLRVFTFSKLLPLSPAGLARFRQGELLNRMVADVDTLDHLYLRVISPLIGALVVILVVTVGLSILDVSLALTLGGIMLASVRQRSPPLRHCKMPLPATRAMRKRISPIGKPLRWPALMCGKVLHGLIYTHGKQKYRHGKRICKVIFCRTCPSLPLWECCMTLRDVLRPSLRPSPAVSVQRPSATTWTERWRVL